ncbi:hypothetical protein TI39_contig395g00017 [Zymoseptoria brevis]|uniref:Uncharacterized protein n=1 Tax=Zymoseptoria brevis TaxID=1047168 RepID=A0A0F4GMU1_9PEZI|nr:hypothetical protein TI39_contig395g00017 [Zymoseptoria brevis]
MAADEDDMSAIWRNLPLDITTIIIIENALTPLQINAYGENLQEHSQALDIPNWQIVRTSLSISHFTRKSAPHTHKSHGAVEHIYLDFPRRFAPPGPYLPEPSFALLRHFRWVFIAQEDSRMFVRMPVAGTLRRVERLESAPMKTMSDEEFEHYMALRCDMGRCKA